MATKKDLVEAHAFNRRRLVTTFLSGSPGGREVEPVRYARVLVGGLLLAVLVVAGAAVSGYIKPATPKKWDETLIIAKGTGSRFVYSKGTFYPIANTASARLFAASNGSLKVVTVSDDEIAKHKIGVQIGIPSAPDALPPTRSMLDTGWVSCANDRDGTRTVISDRVGARAVDGKALLARDAQSGTPYLVAGGYRYPLPAAGAGSPQVRALGLDGLPMHKVNRKWASLFSLGSPVTPFLPPSFGKEVATDVPALSRVGQPATIDGQPYMLIKGRSGRAALLRLTPFADAIYRSATKAVPVKVSLGDVRTIDSTTNDIEGVYPKDWPDGPLEGADTLCAALVDDGGSVSRTTLAETTRPGLVPGADSGDQSISVVSGRGALVSSATGGAKSPTVFLVDSTGTRYAIGGTGDDDEAMKRLGYSGVKTPGVPGAWLNLLSPGPALDVEAARQTASGGS